MTERAGVGGWLERPSHLREGSAITPPLRGLPGRIAAQRRGPRPAPQAASVCPHLGRDGDAGTHNEGANAAHRCFREASRPYAISETYQTGCCLSGEHRQCPAQANGWRRVARKTRKAAVSSAGRRKRSRRSRPALASPFGFAAIIVLVFAAILAAATTIGDFLSDDYERSSGQQLAEEPDGTSTVPSDPGRALVRVFDLE